MLENIELSYVFVYVQPFGEYEPSMVKVGLSVKAEVYAHYIKASYIIERKNNYTVTIVIYVIVIRKI